MYTKRLVEIALKYLGATSIKYKGPEYGLNPEGFDCSGFVVFCLNQISFPFERSIRHCNDFFDFFGVLVHEEYSDQGDLIFLSRDGFRPTHMGIMIDRQTYIHAPGVNDSKVCVEKKQSGQITQKRTDHPVIYSHNPIGFKRLTIPSANTRWKTLLP